MGVSERVTGVMGLKQDAMRGEAPGRIEGVVTGPFCSGRNFFFNEKALGIFK